MEINETIEGHMSLDEILKDPKFYGYVELELRKVKNARAKVLADHPGAKLKRSAYDDIAEQGGIKPTVFIYYFRQIHLEKSKNFSARERKFVSEVIMAAMIAVMDAAKIKPE